MSLPEANCSFQRSTTTFASAAEYEIKPRT
jgi:hypothetical protein